MLVLGLSLQFDCDVRVLVLSQVADDSVSYSLTQSVVVCQPALLFVADAAVEIVAMAGFAPEWDSSLWEQVVHELGDGAVYPLHHGAEVFTNAQVTQRVIVVVEQACYPGDEAELLCVMLEAVPENGLRLFTGEGGEAFAAAR